VIVIDPGLPSSASDALVVRFITTWRDLRGVGVNGWQARWHSVLRTAA